MGIDKRYCTNCEHYGKDTCPSQLQDKKQDITVALMCEMYEKKEEPKGED